MWLGMVAAALGQPADAEITVYGDPLSPWQNTRWWVASETVDPYAPLLLTVDSKALRSPAWQAEAMLLCRVTQPKRTGGWVQCEVEDAAVRVATDDQWQRPRDRRFVQRLLEQVRAELQTMSVRLRVHGAGTVTIAKDQPGRSALVATLLDDAIDGFHLELPEGGWQNGIRWPTYAEPLLDIDLGMGTYGFEQAMHYADAFRGQHLVQTIASANKHVVAGIITHNIPGPRQPNEPRTATPVAPAAPRFLPAPNAGSASEEVALPGRLELHAVADYDLQFGGIRERVWTVRGTGATSRFRSGRLRRLEDDEAIDLGTTEQINPPQGERSGLPEWVALSERNP